MAKYVANYLLNRSDQYIEDVSKNFFSKAYFYPIELNGERLWERTAGMGMGPLRMRFRYANGIIHLEAWASVALLPGIYVGHLGPEGSKFAKTREELKKCIEGLMVTLFHDPSYKAHAGVPTEAQIRAAQEKWQDQDQISEGQLELMEHDAARKATKSIVLGVISILTVFLPIVSVLCGAFGVSNAIAARKATKNRVKATIALILNLLGILATIVVCIWYMTSVYTE